LVNIIMTYDQPSAARSKNPTWLSMLLTEPPITTAWIEVFPHFHWPMTTAMQATLQDSGGLTFGMVRDAADRMLAPPALESHGDKNPITTRICFIVNEAASRPLEPLEEQRNKFRGFARY
jgi:hypothetical protein